MFFLAQKNTELANFLRQKKTNGPIREYERLVKSLDDAVSLMVYASGAPPDFDTEPKSYLRFNQLVDWAKDDWETIFNRLDEDWIIVFIARGGFILLDEIENNIDDYIWTYIKPNLSPRQHEPIDIAEEFTDENLKKKLKNFKGETLNILFIEDIVEEDEYEANIVIVMEELADKLEDYDIEIGETACVSLLTRTAQISSIPVYGILVSWSGGLQTDWGNDNPERLDYHDFSENLEYIADHDI